MVDCTIL
jgi:protein SDA1